jgi:hypothetical protein
VTPKRARVLTALEAAGIATSMELRELAGAPPELAEAIARGRVAAEFMVKAVTLMGDDALESMRNELRLIAAATA